MSDSVLVAIISVGLGGLFTAIFKFIDTKANQAKDRLNKNTIEVEALNKALEGMETLANNLRTDYDREHQRAERETERANREHDRAEGLQKDLIEEKAVNLALSRQKKESKE